MLEILMLGISTRNYRQEYPSAAASLREGLDEMFTINRLGLPVKLRRCLSSTNVIDSPRAGVRRVSRWQDGSMVLRWAASAFLDMEKRFRRIMGHKQLWIPKAVLDESNEEVAQRKQAG